MTYRITGGIFFLLLGMTDCGIAAVPGIIIGVFGIIAGVALLAGI